MSSVLGKGGTGNLTSTEGTVFDVTVDGVKAQAFSITNNDTANDALVRIPELHGSANWYPIKPGQNRDFVLTRRGAYLKQIYAKSSSGTVSISGGPTAGD